MIIKKEVPLRYLGQLGENPIEVFNQVKEQQRQRLEEMRERKSEQKIEQLVEEKLEEVVEKELKKLFDGFNR